MKIQRAVAIFVVGTLALGTVVYFGKGRHAGAPAWVVFLMAAVISAGGAVVHYTKSRDS